MSNVLSNNAGAIQAISTSVLVLVTMAYVYLTWRTVTHAEEVQTAERRRRRKLAFLSIITELEEILNACQYEDGNLHVTPLPTESWDAMKGEILFLGEDVVAKLARTYQLARQCNARYRALTTRPELHGEPTNQWQRRVGILKNQVEETLTEINKVDADTMIKNI